MHGRQSALRLLTAALLTVPLSAWAQDDAVPAFKQLDSMEARVQGCVTCHGQSGQGTSNGYFPRIAGKPAGYLYNQLVAFRDGTRQYAPMNYLVAYLPDAYCARSPSTSPSSGRRSRRTDAAPADAATLARGQALVTAGDREQAACRPASPATARASPAWSPASRAWSACGRPTSSRSSRAGASASGTPPSPTA